MEKAVGETITLVRTNPATGAEVRERARVLAANGGVVLQIGDRIEVLRDDGLPVRVIFDRVPENLRARPTLSVTVQSERAGRRPVTLTYLSAGLGWSADYVALFDEANGRMDVQGWITLTNNSGTPYVNANTLLVAGAVGGEQPADQLSPPPAGPDPQSRHRDLEPRAARRFLPLSAGRADHDRQPPDQAGQLPRRARHAGRRAPMNMTMPGSRRPSSRSAPTPCCASRLARGQGLGDALPAGTVRVYQRDARGNPQFVGESAIGHTPMGSELGLTTGQAFDVKVRAVVERRERVNGDRWRTTMRYTLTNARPEAGDGRSAPAGPVGRHQDRRGEPAERRAAAADAAFWHVPVPANGEATVTATFDTRF